MSDVRVLVGFASEEREEKDVHGRSTRLLPVPEAVSGERLFVTMVIDRELLEGEPADREPIADHVAELLSDKLRQLILDGPSAVVEGPVPV